jgi:hypothetical protein
MSRDNRNAIKTSSTPETISDAELLNALREARTIGRRLRAVARAKYKAVMEPARIERNSLELQAEKDYRQARENAQLHLKKRMETAKEKMLSRASELEKLHHVVIEKTEGQAIWKRVVAAATSAESVQTRNHKWQTMQKESLSATFAAILQPVFESMNVEIEGANEEHTASQRAAYVAREQTYSGAGRALGRLRNQTRFEGKAGRQAAWHRYLVHGNVGQLLAEMRELTTP